MITPDYTIPMLEERPRERIRSTIITRIPIVGYIFHKLSQRKWQKEMQALMNLIAWPKDRSELERLLGKPRYALPGDSENSVTIQGETFVQDRVEVYEVKNQIVFDFSFAKDRLIGIIGCVKPWTAERVVFQKKST